MSAQTRGLGKGLGALIPSPGATAGETEAHASGLLHVAVSDIVPNPRQPRMVIDETALAELAASIKEHGLIQPLIITRAAPTARTPYQLIAGERRWRAAQLAGLSVVPALLKEATPEQLLELALVENIQRADLNPLEEAEAYQALITEFGLNQQSVADRVGKSRVAVANTLRLLRLPEGVKALLGEGALSEGHARALLPLPDDEAILDAAARVVRRGLSVRQTEEFVRRLLDPATHAAAEEDEAGDADPAGTRRLEDAFRQALGTRVRLTRGARGGKVVINFYSDEELQTIYERIVGFDA